MAEDELEHEEGETTVPPVHDEESLAADSDHEEAGLRKLQRLRNPRFPRKLTLRCRQALRSTGTSSTLTPVLSIRLPNRCAAAPRHLVLPIALASC